MNPMHDFDLYIPSQDVADLNPAVNNPNSNASKLPTRALALSDESIIDQVLEFHQSIPDYQASPLIELSGLAQKVGVKRILVKDESGRFNLKAFKGLGASYAIARLLSTHLGHNKVLSYNELRQRKDEYCELEFATTTDGNHGKAVAWGAQLFGCRSHIFMPKGTLSCRKEAIQVFTDQVEITDQNYDQTVELCAELAQKNHWHLVQDTAWPGYTKIPADIMRGYFTICSEFCSQTDQWPTHLFLQAGVGSFAAAVALYFYTESKTQRRPMPKVILVEPTNAACFYQSAKQGRPVEVGGEHKTIMAGLACGRPSDLAWEILWSLTTAYFSCQDPITILGMKRFADPIAKDAKVISGESAAVTLGLLESLLSNPAHHAMNQKIGLNENAVPLFFSTEGDTNPDYYQALTNQQPSI